MAQPTLYLSHGGGPCFFMDWTMGPADSWDGLKTWLATLVEALPERPSALLVISAHWEAPVATVQSGANPPLLFDYSGFPAHTYQLEWPAPGDPVLARRVGALLGEAGLPWAEDPVRGFDHGTFVPLKVALPAADLPTLQLSLRQGLDPAEHLAIGRALAPLRDEGVLIVGSGSSYHNLRKFGRSAGASADAFDRWLAETASAPAERRVERLLQWAAAPGGRGAHPREEHLLPMMVAVGAAGTDPGRRVFHERILGAPLACFEWKSARNPARCAHRGEFPVAGGAQR